METKEPQWINLLKFNEQGLIPVIVQDYTNGRVLMMAWMNKEALHQTLITGKTVFWSRSRKKYWMKGETSGHYQYVKNIQIDCDADTILIQVEQKGVACHEGYRSCFFRTVEVNKDEPSIIEERLIDPTQLYSKE